MLICVIQRYFADPGVSRFFVAWLPVRDLLLCAKHLLLEAIAALAATALGGVSRAVEKY
jgi:hypothetical protein